ncbi:hypothetical protein I553_9036 [Mycobacterium xenopi 4042]|uniref:Uncharacterized protein n=1 Tax=Mycobacterium xenopi 4042 TaxID=1299334 RepID=X8AP87_MYCXE|nr:hypothetical protein I553_9036 [Mycobacterium xenopi 4042]
MQPSVEHEQRRPGTGEPIGTAHPGVNGSLMATHIVVSVGP